MEEALQEITDALRPILGDLLATSPRLRALAEQVRCALRDDATAKGVDVTNEAEARALFVGVLMMRQVQAVHDMAHLQREFAEHSAVVESVALAFLDEAGA